MEVEQGLPLQASHLVMSLHIVFPVQWLSNLMQHQGAPGKLLIIADFLGRPEVLIQRPGWGSELGGVSSNAQKSLPSHGHLTTPGKTPSGVSLLP